MLGRNELCHGVGVGMRRVGDDRHEGTVGLLHHDERLVGVALRLRGGRCRVDGSARGREFHVLLGHGSKVLFVGSAGGQALEGPPLGGTLAGDADANECTAEEHDRAESGQGRQEEDSGVNVELVAGCGHTLTILDLTQVRVQLANALAGDGRAEAWTNALSERMLAAQEGRQVDILSLSHARADSTTSCKRQSSLVTPLTKLGAVLGSVVWRQRISTTVLRWAPVEQSSPLP